MSKTINGVFTVRNSGCGKVMFLRASVILSMGGKGLAWQGVCMAEGSCMAGGHAW